MDHLVRRQTAVKFARLFDLITIAVLEIALLYHYTHLIPKKELREEPHRPNIVSFIFVVRVKTRGNR